MILQDIGPSCKGSKREERFKHLNVFQACDDSYVVDALLNEEAILRSPYHKITEEGNRTKIFLDKSAPDYDDLFGHRGNAVAPDDILEVLKPLTLKIPIKYREEFGPDQLPLAELLSALQYYASHLELPKNSMDETALLALGILAESWADEMVSESVALMFMELAEGNTPASAEDMYGPSSDSDLLDSLDGDVVCGSDDDSDIMSLEMEESDTEDEESESNRSDVASVSSSSSFSDSGTTCSDSAESEPETATTRADSKSFAPEAKVFPSGSAPSGSAAVSVAGSAPNFDVSGSSNVSFAEPERYSPSPSPSPPRAYASAAFREATKVAPIMETLTEESSDAESNTSI